MNPAHETVSSPHQGQVVLTAGEPLGQARAAMILVHGRGSNAENIMSLAEELAQPGFAFLAPQAMGGTWYPNSFMAPIESNEPCLSSALAALGDVVAQVTATGIALERTILLGFSQGACLSLEYSARHPPRGGAGARPYGAVVGLSGGLIGPEGTPRDYPGSLAGTPVFLGCSDVDFHIPKERVLHSADVLRVMGAQVTVRLYAHMGHTVNADEIAFVREMMAAIL